MAYPERIIPDETPAGILALHLKRYALVAEFAEGCTVLDAACGVGYGAAYVAEVAAKVLGDVRAAGVAERHVAALPPLSESDAARARYGFLRRLATSYHVLADRGHTRRAALAAAWVDPQRALHDSDVRGPFIRSFAPAWVLQARRPPLGPTI